MGLATPHPTHAEVLSRAYEIGTHVGQAATVLAVLLAVLIWALVWRRSRRIKAEKDVLLAVSKRPLGVLPFAALLIGAGVLFIVLFCAVTMRLALSQGEAAGSTREGPPTAVGGVGTDFGKNLGGGLLEFRVDQNAEQILRKAGKNPRPELVGGKILLRVFFHVHGDKLI